MPTTNKTSILSVKDKATGEWIGIPAIRGRQGEVGPQGEQGEIGPVGPSGVYTGSEPEGGVPADYDVWIDPEDRPTQIVSVTAKQYADLAKDPNTYYYVYDPTAEV